MSQKDNSPQITDEMVKEFLKTHYDHNKVADWWERFKALHSSSEKVEKNWEVVTVWQNKGSCTEVKNGKVRYAPFSDCTLEDALQNRGYTFHSIRRISDNELFTVGDEVKTNAELGCNDWWGKISSFWITGGGDMHIVYNGHHYDISTFEKKAPIPEEKPSVKPPIGIMPELLYRSERFNHLSEAIDNYEKANKNVPSEWRSELKELNSWLNDYHSKEKPVLFTTEDGKDVFKGDTYWIVLEQEYNYEIVKCTCGDIGISIDRPGVRHFSTEQAANEYVTMNKPCLNLTEIDNILAKEIREGGAFSSTPIRKIWHSLKQLASSKIKGDIK